MEDEVKVTTKGSSPAVYVGLEISGGPGVKRLLLSWPYDRAGEIVEIPLEEIDNVADVDPHPMGAPPPVSD